MYLRKLQNRIELWEQGMLPQGEAWETKVETFKSGPDDSESWESKIIKLRAEVYDTREYLSPNWT